MIPFWESKYNSIDSSTKNEQSFLHMIKTDKTLFDRIRQIYARWKQSNPTTELGKSMQG